MTTTLCPERDLRAEPPPVITCGEAFDFARAHVAGKGPIFLLREAARFLTLAADRLNDPANETANETAVLVATNMLGLFMTAAGHPEFLTDKERLDLDAELQALDIEYRRLIAAMADRSIRRTDEEIYRLIDETNAIEDRMLSIQPKTVAGLAVQLFVVWRIKADSDNQVYDGPDETANFDIMAVWTVLKNAERLAGAA